MPGDFLDLSSDPTPSQPTNSGDAGSAARRFLGITFACCSVYSRIYVNRDGNAYVGNCPRCSKRVEIKIGPGGGNSRFFTAY